MSNPELEIGDGPVIRWHASNVVPAWVLPLRRLMRARGGLRAAWRRLPEALPPGTEMPTVEEAAAVLLTLGLAR